MSVKLAGVVNLLSFDKVNAAGSVLCKSGGSIAIYFAQLTTPQVCMA